MSEYDEIKMDVDDFVSTYGESLKAIPNENQYIVSHIMKQIQLGARKKPDERLKGERGYETVFVFERRGLEIRKRLFHPRDFNGVDFALTKYAKHSHAFLGVTAVQVKRNRGKTAFEFEEREIRQLKLFLDYWGSGYYLFVDETASPPSFCFVRTSELSKIIVNMTNNPKILDSPRRVIIPNHAARRYCRGSKLFYDYFYNCSRGQKISRKTFYDRAKEYTNEALRILVELLTVHKPKAYR